MRLTMTISLITFLKAIRPGYSINENDATFVTSPNLDASIIRQIYRSTFSIRGFLSPYSSIHT